MCEHVSLPMKPDVPERASIANRREKEMAIVGDANEASVARDERTDTNDDDARAAFESLKPVLIEMDDGALIPIRYTATEAVVRGLWVSDNAERDLEQFEATYREPPVEEIQSLRRRTLAVKGAELAEKPAASLSPPDVDRTKVLRKKFIAVERAVFLGDDEKQAELDEIEKGYGHRDLGSDGIMLADIADQNWTAIAPTELIDRAEVDELRRRSLDVLHWAGRREGKSQSSSRLMEQRAWSYMAEAYNEIRDLAFSMYRNNKALWERDYPSLYAEKPPK